MLTITIPGGEVFNEETQEFSMLKPHVLTLEHSLVSLSKWESKWHKPFLAMDEKTDEEVLDYIRCMTLTQNVKPEVYARLTRNNIDSINSYIDDPMTATTFSKDKGRVNKEIITSELIYYWMIQAGIPVEFQKWHLNRLLTLIKVCAIKSEPPKKMGKSALMSRNAQLNAARRKQFNTKG